jgi:hypothetical protein
VKFSPKCFLGTNEQNTLQGKITKEYKVPRTKALGGKRRKPLRGKPK